MSTTWNNLGRPYLDGGEVSQRGGGHSSQLVATDVDARQVDTDAHEGVHVDDGDFVAKQRQSQQRGEAFELARTKRTDLVKVQIQRHQRCQSFKGFGNLQGNTTD